MESQLEALALQGPERAPLDPPDPKLEDFQQDFPLLNPANELVDGYDIILETKDQRKLYCHRSLLALHSKLLKTALALPMESHEQPLKLPFTFSDILPVLEYIYHIDHVKYYSALDPPASQLVAAAARLDCPRIMHAVDAVMMRYMVRTIDPEEHLRCWITEVIRELRLDTWWDPPATGGCSQQQKDLAYSNMEGFYYLLVDRLHFISTFVIPLIQRMAGQCPTMMSPVFASYLLGSLLFFKNPGRWVCCRACSAILSREERKAGGEGHVGGKVVEVTHCHYCEQSTRNHGGYAVQHLSNLINSLNQPKMSAAFFRAGIPKHKQS